jgi:SAM-dependent methyltransferase
MRRYLHHHHYPGWLLRRPRLIDWLHGWHDLTLQRNLLVRRHADLWVRMLLPPVRILDAGCGDGQHSLPLLRRFPHLTVCLLDRHREHLLFLESYCRSAGFPNTTRRLDDLCRFVADEPFDLALCVGMLQYVDDDQAALAALHRALRPGGVLLLYVPVNNRRILPRLTRRRPADGDYETAQGRRRIYRPDGIDSAVRNAGFRLLGCHATYGPIGIAGHELYQRFLSVLANAKGWHRWTILPALLLLPPALALVRLDHLLPKKDGNGRLLIACKSASIG